MPKSPAEITAQAREIYALASTSDTPLNVVGLHGTILLASQEWAPADVEQVNGEVMSLLIKHGWKHRPDAR